MYCDIKYVGSHVMMEIVWGSSISKSDNEYPYKSISSDPNSHHACGGAEQPSMEGPDYGLPGSLADLWKCLFGKPPLAVFPGQKI